MVSIYVILRPQIESPKVLSLKLFFMNNISFKTRKIESAIFHKQRTQTKKSNRRNILFWTKFSYKLGVR